MGLKKTFLKDLPDTDAKTRECQRLHEPNMLYCGSNHYLGISQQTSDEAIETEVCF